MKNTTGKIAVWVVGFAVIIGLALLLWPDENPSVSNTGSSSSAGISVEGFPPCRVSENTVEASLGRIFNFTEAYTHAKAVALVKIGKWLCEDLNTGITYYEAEVLTSYKGKLPKTIILKQDGASNGTISGYPLFTMGNEFVVYLDESTMGLYVENCYWILGSWTTAFRVARDDAGNAYLIDNNLGILEAASEQKRDYPEQLRQQIQENYIRQDAYWQGKTPVGEKFLLSLEDFAMLLID